jgi:hypothetical protein
MDLNEKSIQWANKMGPRNFVIMLLTIGLVGGTGTATIVRDIVIGTEINDHIERLHETLESLNENLRRQQRIIEAQEDLITRTRCEIRASRDEFDWRDCWTPDRRRL